ncbi:MAG: hypothetical protein IJ002_05335 [Clostridia bacterium]|nr:hypothetical protein [Clostridia bacterium]
MNQGTKFERGALVTLSVMLVCVFLLSVHMYDAISQGTAEGVLATFADGARNFVYENEAVAAFLGIEQPTVTVYQNENVDIAAEAAAYITRYNEIYENTK